MAVYEIEFECEGMLRTWTCEAWDKEEALGIFWESHRRETRILEVLEVAAC